MDKRIVFIVLGGRLETPSFLQHMWELYRPLAVICADGGAKNAWEAGLLPTLIVGDLDSLPDEVRSHFDRAGVPREIHPAEKDETDAVIAFNRALTMSPEEIWVFGAFGGRVDHLLANLSLLLMGEKEHVFVKFLDEGCEIYLVSGEKLVAGKEGDLVSILALFGEARGITLDGFRYPLLRGVMRPDFPLGISNRLTENQAKINVESGKLLVIRYFSSEGGG